MAATAARPSREAADGSRPTGQMRPEKVQETIQISIKSPFTLINCLPSRSSGSGSPRRSCRPLTGSPARAFQPVSLNNARRRSSPFVVVVLVVVGAGRPRSLRRASEWAGRWPWRAERNVQLALITRSQRIAIVSFRRQLASFSSSSCFSFSFFFCCFWLALARHGSAANSRARKPVLARPAQQSSWWSAPANTRVRPRAKRSPSGFIGRRLI